MNDKNITIIMIIFGLIFISLSHTIIKADTNQIPAVTITSPKSGDLLLGEIIITGTALDTDGTIQKVEVKIDTGEMGQAIGTTDWIYLWDTTNVTDGLHSISARSYDGENYSPISKILVRIDNQGGGINEIPTITIMDPVDNDTISGIITINGTISGGEGRNLIAQIQINSGPWGKVLVLKNIWTYTWDTTTSTNGLHTINARSYDGIKYSLIKTIKVTVSNVVESSNQIPTITIKNPADNDTISGIITINGTASDIDGKIQYIQIKIDGGLWKNITGKDSWNYSWNTTTLTNGIHTIYARSYDGKNYSDLYLINVIISNEIEIKNEIPIIKITYPLKGDNLSGVTTIYGVASDNDGIIKFVQIKINEGLWENANGTNLWNYSWDTTNANNDEYIIYAKSYDGTNYSHIESIVVKIKNSSTPGFQLLSLIFGIIIIYIFIFIEKNKNIKK